MKRIIPQIPAFLIANAVGFFSSHVCYLIGLKSGIISNPEFDLVNLPFFFQAINVTWMICAVFSLASFFTEGWTRNFFLLAPIIFPLGYGLRLLLLPL